MSATILVADLRKDWTTDQKPRPNLGWWMPVYLSDHRRLTPKLLHTHPIRPEHFTAISLSTIAIVMPAKADYKPQRKGDRQKADYKKQRKNGDRQNADYSSERKEIDSRLREKADYNSCRGKEIDKMPRAEQAAARSYGDASKTVASPYQAVFNRINSCRNLAENDQILKGRSLYVSNLSLGWNSGSSLLT